jgi:hypothetical protein
MGHIRKKLTSVTKIEEYKGRKASRARDAHQAIAPDYKMRDTPPGDFIDAEALGWYDEPVYEDSDPTPPFGMRRPPSFAVGLFSRPIDRFFRFIEGPDSD